MKSNAWPTHSPQVFDCLKWQWNKRTLQIVHHMMLGIWGLDRIIYYYMFQNNWRFGFLLVLMAIYLSFLFNVSVNLRTRINCHVTWSHVHLPVYSSVDVENISLKSSIKVTLNSPKLFYWPCRWNRRPLSIPWKRNFLIWDRSKRKHTWKLGYLP